MITEIAGAVRSISDLADGILTRADRDKPDKDLDERLAKIQDAFANNTVDSDEFRAWIDQLFRSAGVAVTPQGDVQLARREFTHAALVLASQRIHDRELASRAIYALERRT